MGNTFGWTVAQVEEYEFIGRGGFGLVYYVNYPFYFRKYAVKLVELPDASIKNMARKEVKSLEK